MKKLMIWAVAALMALPAAGWAGENSVDPGTEAELPMWPNENLVVGRQPITRNLRLSDQLVLPGVPGQSLLPQSNHQARTEQIAQRLRQRHSTVTVDVRGNSVFAHLPHGMLMSGGLVPSGRSIFIPKSVANFVPPTKPQPKPASTQPNPPVRMLLVRKSVLMPQVGINPDR